MPSFEALETICDFFNITLSDFFDECYERDSSVEYLAIKLREIIDDDELVDLLKVVDAIDKDAIKALLRVFRNYSENRK